MFRYIIGKRLVNMFEFQLAIEAISDRKVRHFHRSISLFRRRTRYYFRPFYNTSRILLPECFLLIL